MSIWRLVFGCTCHISIALNIYSYKFLRIRSLYRLIFPFMFAISIFRGSLFNLRSVKMMTSNQQYKYYLKLDNQSIFDKGYPVLITKQFNDNLHMIYHKDYEFIIPLWSLKTSRYLKSLYVFLICDIWTEKTIFVWGLWMTLRNIML